MRYFGPLALYCAPLMTMPVTRAHFLTIALWHAV